MRENKQLTPFHDKKGELVFLYQPLRDLIFIWPLPPPERIGEVKLLHIPEQSRKQYQGGIGIVLAVGPGYQNDKGIWKSLPPPELKSGVKVKFDINVPWGNCFTAQDGKEYYVCLCGISDVYGIVKD